MRVCRQWHAMVKKIREQHAEKAEGKVPCPQMFTIAPITASVAALAL